MDDFQARGSGWVLSKIDNLELRINKYNPLRGSSYIELPDKIKNKKAIINVKNEDNKCFMWSILSAIHPVDKDPQRVLKYREFKNELNFKGIEFPVALTDITKFEKLNNISVNVYGYEQSIVTLRITDNKREKHANLFYIQDKDNGHYCWIKNLSRLIRNQISNNKKRIYPCERCLTYYYSAEKLKTHEIDCKGKKAVKIEMPRKYESIYFKNDHNSLRVPFVIYADFECLTRKIDTCQPDESKSYTLKYQKHEPMSFSYYIKYEHGEYKAPVVYRGPDAVAKFYECHICNKPIITWDNYKKYGENPVNMEGKKVRDHDHLTGLYRGPAHETCNLCYQNPKFVPVFIHNLAGYDAHLFIKGLGYDEEDIDVIPNTEEKYISSIESLSKNLKKEQYRETAKYIPKHLLNLVIRKGVYPYDYMDTWEKCNETQLPSKEEFYSKLNESNISDEDYKHAQNVWKAFKIRDMGDYSDLYVKTDVLILTDIIENFRDVCLKTYKLDPCWYYTAPGLAWDAMLKITEVNLDLLTDYDMILMLEKGTRGGISQCCNRYAKANNKYMKDYNKDKESNYLMYLDANNLYGWAMSQYLPYGDFKWSQINIDVTQIPDDSDTGYILEVDLKYSKKLHKKHSDLPLAPENRIPDGSSQSKLLTTLHDKKNYVIHYRNLKQCLEMGLKLKKIHRVLEFKQSPWLKKYIDLNTDMRTIATNDFEKDFYKLMNNSVFGKTMENIRKRVDIKLCCNAKKAEKLISKPNFKDRTIFAENLTAIHMNKTKVYFNKPIYVGMSILDLSKQLMFDFHYKVMKPKYDKNLKLLYQDTDSYIYEIKTDDFYSDMKDMIDHFDTSDYKENNEYGIPRVNKKVLGKMKDENNGKIMTEFVGLRAKMYALKVEDKVIKKSKGVKKIVVKNRISFEDYKDCLFNKVKKYRAMNLIRSHKHEIYSVQVNKIALSPDDDKRHILEDGINTLALGHYKIT
ncbi:uncharacterized protein LOC129222404 [Uloborus diversus]|uniref:uncharacterized protein LOC129222404 n=1 Tax=Uloborus diversus TaxID=327109 RepID=UPI002409FD87|nr:uncharacterized protein LOC129222404 [Uloborus diversus]